ncbi:MAG: hypothetical protein GC199_01030 [Alphaproteobacteria bacterium]|nr:hypothetical protein [Alphaproteobacteria bacterium]
MRKLLAALLAGFAVGAAGAHAAEESPRIPRIEAEDLNGRDIVIPADIPGERTLVFIAFEQEQQFDVDSWIEGLNLRESELPWLEFPVVTNYGFLFRVFLDNAMRGGIETEEARSHVVTLYTSQEGFRDAAGLPHGDRIYAAVIDRDGAILALQDGPYTDEKAAPLLAVLGGAAGPLPSPDESLMR